MKAGDLKSGSEAGKNAGTVLGQIDKYVDSIHNDYANGHWIKGTIKTVAGGGVAALLITAACKMGSGGSGS